MATKFFRCLTAALPAWGAARAGRRSACIRKPAHPAHSFKNVLRRERKSFISRDS